MSSEQLLQLGFEYHQQGLLDEAKPLYQAALRQSPQHPDTWYLLGLLEHEAGQLELAMQAFQTAYELAPLDEPAPLSVALSTVLTAISLKQFAQAAEILQRLLQDYPTESRVWKLSGVLSHEEGDYEQAVSALSQAKKLNPEDPEVYHNLGRSFQALNRRELAEEAYKNALQLDPSLSDSWRNLGQIYQLKDRLRCAPNENPLDESIACLEKAIALNSEDVEACNALGFSYELACKTEQAKEAYQHALSLQPENFLWWLRLETLCPMLPESREQIQQYRESLLKTLHALCEALPREIDVASLWAQLPHSGAEPPFWLSYQAENDVEIKQAYNRLFQKLFAPLCQQPETVSNLAHTTGVGQVAFLLTENHEGIFCQFMEGLIVQLALREAQKPVEDRIQYRIICPVQSMSFLQARIPETLVAYTRLPEDFLTAIQTLKTLSLDVLYYWEVGSDSVNYFLPYFRLASVQCVSWGIPVTTGISTMDYYLSSQLIESVGSEPQYTETLHCFDTLPTYYLKPALPAALKTRQDLGLPEDAVLYGCMQSLFKFHPDFDPVLREILRANPKARLVMAGGKQSQWEDVLLARWRKTLGEDCVSKIHWLSRLGREDFLQVTAQIDVMLDPLHFGGGNTIYEALALGVPIVTLPSNYMRGRIALGCYQKMGLTDWVCDTPVQYVQQAILWGQDVSLREQLKLKIFEKNATLYEETHAVEAFAQFFEAQIATIRGLKQPS